MNKIQPVIPLGHLARGFFLDRIVQNLLDATPGANGRMEMHELAVRLSTTHPEDASRVENILKDILQGNYQLLAARNSRKTDALLYDLYAELGHPKAIDYFVENDNPTLGYLYFSAAAKALALHRRQDGGKSFLAAAEQKGFIDPQEKEEITQSIEYASQAYTPDVSRQGPVVMKTHPTRPLPDFSMGPPEARRNLLNRPEKPVVTSR